MPKALALLASLVFAIGISAGELRAPEGKVVVVPIDDAGARVVVLDGGVWLVCWRVVEGPQAFQCRGMTAYGLPCSFDGGRFKCDFAPTPAPPSSNKKELDA